jgi:hypothetical protein
MIFLNKDFHPILQRVCFHVELLRSSIRRNEKADEQDRQRYGTFHGVLAKVLSLIL